MQERFIVLESKMDLTCNIETIIPKKGTFQEIRKVSFFNGAPGGARFSRVKVVCSASCYQFASESLVKVIASEPCSEPPVPLGDQLC